jgi:aspartyl-tRNA(Asn)/glutamyl-tRNA(Gln) amidotransferase subunit C
MKLSIKEVQHIADLARLKLSDTEKQRYVEQLSDILDYVDHLNELDTDHIPPTASVLSLQLRLRDDEARDGLSQEEVLGSAAETQDGQFKVPPVLGG